MCPASRGLKNTRCNTEVTQVYTTHVVRMYTYIIYLLYPFCVYFLYIHSVLLQNTPIESILEVFLGLVAFGKRICSFKETKELVYLVLGPGTPQHTRTAL